MSTSEAGSGVGAGMMKGGALLAAGLAVSNAFGYALNLAASRLLGPRDFGAFAALMGVVLVANVGALALQSVTARRLATDGPAAAPELLRLGRRAAFGIGAALALAAPALSAFLHLDGVQVLLVAATMVPLTLVGTRMGIAQGTERFGALAVLYMLVAVGRMGGTLVGLAIRDDVPAGLLGGLAGATAAALAAAVIAPAPHAGSRREDGVVRELVTAAAALFAFFGLTNVDVLLARHSLDSHDAGIYALGAVVAKGAFWFPAFVAVLAFPMLVDENRRGQAMRVSLSLVVASGAMLTAGTALLPDLAVDLVGGNDYAELANDVGWFALAGSLFALVQLLIYARLAQGDPRAGIRVGAVLAALVVAVLGVANGSVVEIVLSVCVAATVLALAGLATELRVFSDVPSGSGESVPVGDEPDDDRVARADGEVLEGVDAQDVADGREYPERQEPAR